MADEKNKNINESTEEIKKEKKNTVKDVKETIKKVNIKDDAKDTSNFVVSMFNKPLETLKKIANDSKNANFKNALILIIVWLVAIAIARIADFHWAFRLVGTNFMSLLKGLLTPILGILALSCIIYFMKKSSKKSLTTIITTVTIALVPNIVISLISLLSIFSSNFNLVIAPLSGFANVITVIFEYFAIKALINESENSKFIKTFMIIQGIYFICYFAISFLGIYLPRI